jgi:hypothetical protein
MARFWKEPYTLERAAAVGIRENENIPVLGVAFRSLHDPTFRAWPRWIYYVEVCRFTFGFFSLEMIREYLGFYSRKILPSSRFYDPPIRRALPLPEMAKARRGTSDCRSDCERSRSGFEWSRRWSGRWRSSLTIRRTDSVPSTRPVGTGAGMKHFLQRFGAFVLGLLGGFDRTRFRGTQIQLCYPNGLLGSLAPRAIRGDFKAYAPAATEQLVPVVEPPAQQRGLCRHLNTHPVSPEQGAVEITAQRNRTQGLIAVLGRGEMPAQLSRPQRRLAVHPVTELVPLHQAGRHPRPGLARLADESSGDRLRPEGERLHGGRDNGCQQKIQAILSADGCTDSDRDLNTGCNKNAA